MIKAKDDNPITCLIILIVSSLVFTCLFIEVILRLSGYNPFGNLLNGRESILQVSNNVVRSYEATPNSEALAWGTQVKINSHGMRDREYTIAKNIETHRIITLGDSVAFGNQIPVKYTFSDQLETLLRESQKEIEVLNLSLGGYNTLQEVATLEEIGLQFQPDLVVIAYVINDAGVASPNLEYIKRVQRYDSLIFKSRLAQFVRDNLDKISLRLHNQRANDETNFALHNSPYIVDVSDDQKLTRLTDKLRKELDKNDGNFSSHASWYISQTHLGHLRYSLERLHRLQVRHGFDTVVVTIPYLAEDDSNESIYRIIYEIVEYESKRIDADVINTHDSFRAEGFDNLLISQNDFIHPNRVGHRLIAETLFDYVKSKRINEQEHSK